MGLGKLKIEGEFKGRVMAPHLADEQHPEGLGFRVRRFNPDILQSNAIFSSAIDALRAKYKVVVIPGLDHEQADSTPTANMGWRWGHTGNRPIDKLPHVDELRSVGLYAQDDTTPPRRLAVCTFKEGCAAYLKALEYSVGRNTNWHAGYPLEQLMLAFREVDHTSRYFASNGVDRIRYIMPSGPDSDPFKRAWLTEEFESNFVKKVHRELGIGGPKPKALVHTHKKGTLVAVSGDVFHFSAGGNLNSGTIRFTFLGEFNRKEGK